MEELIFSRQAIFIASVASLALYLLLRWRKHVARPMSRLSVARVFMDGGALYTFLAIFLAHHLMNQEFSVILERWQLSESFNLAIAAAVFESAWGLLVVLEFVNKPAASTATVATVVLPPDIPPED